MLFRPGNPDDRIHHHALDRDRQPNLGRDKSQIGRIRTNHTGPKDDRPPSRIENTLPALRPSSADRQGRFTVGLMADTLLRAYERLHTRVTFNFCLNLFLAEKPRNATCKKSGAKKPILLIFKAFILPIPIQQDAKWK